MNLAPKVYLVYDIKDLEYVTELERLLPPDFVKLIEKDDEAIDRFKKSPVEDIHDYLHKKIEAADLLLFILGKNTHNNQWSIREAEVALALKKPIVGIKIPIGYPGGLPILLKKRNIEIVPWTQRKLHPAIERALQTSVA